MNTNILSEIKDLIQDNNIASLATASLPDAIPEISTIYYWYDGVRSIYFVTLDDSRKFQNLIVNNNVALAVLNKVSMQELQIEGNGFIVDNPDDKISILTYIHKTISKDESTAIWPIMKLHPKDLVVVRIIIQNFKYSNFLKKPHVSEGTFADLV